MTFRWHPREQVALGRFVGKWLLLGVPTGALVGTAVAAFLWSLEKATEAQWHRPWLLFLLPIAGVGIGLMYSLLGKSVVAGNNLILDQIHKPGGGGVGGVPLRMAPLVLIGTVVTHLFGGSAGREGTAIQMGGAIAGELCRRLRIGPADARLLLTAGMAAGFGAVFGTPLAGAVFAIEVLAIGRMSYAALVPCLIASVVGDWTALAWDVSVGGLRFRIAHTAYAVANFAGGEHLSPVMLGKVAVAATAFGLAGLLFAELTHGLQSVFKKFIRRDILRPFVGGLVVIGLVYLIGTRDYLGLGVHAPPSDPNGVSIVSCFAPGGATAFSWWWKILFTAVTLGSGFKGGEVTPLFFVGAALGNAMAVLLHAPVDLFAALGFVAVFAGATNTPLACTIMAIELFGGGHSQAFTGGFVVYAATACCLAYVFSGHSGIYLSQRIGTPKLAGDFGVETSLRDVRTPAAKAPRKEQDGAEQ